MPVAKSPVIVVGAGIGGLCAAIALSQRECRVTVLERSREIRGIGAGIQLGPNVFRVLDRLGLTEDVRHAAVFPERLVVRDSMTGDIVTDFSVLGQFRRRFGYPYALIHRGDLHHALLRRCQTHPLITVRPAQAVVDFDVGDDGVIVRTEDGSTHWGAALVGADGIWSYVRARIVKDGLPRRSGHIAYRAVLRADDMPAHLRSNAMTLWAGPRNHLVHYPLRGHELYNVVAAFESDRHSEGWDTTGDPIELWERFAPVVDDVKTILAKIATWRMWVLADRDPISRWSQGCVTLVGDAAHPMLQYLGQGAGMAVEDAIVLAEEVEAAGHCYEQAFAAYEQRRYLRTGRVQLTSRLYGEFFHAEGASRDIRNHFLAERTEEAACESLAWLYDGPDLQHSVSTETSPCHTL
jgi:3-hydroxybenzoate 6-monooxygenase